MLQTSPLLECQLFGEKKYNFIIRPKKSNFIIRLRLPSRLTGHWLRIQGNMKQDWNIQFESNQGSGNI